ncbi:MAG: YbhB/YbcL family Raf kinase inhibitor-like protein [Armatimonadota bacterium]
MATLSVTSTAFKGGEMIPQRYACDGENVSPSLSWDNVPEKTESLAIICDDPDAPSGMFSHWVLYNLPRGTTQILESMPKDEELQDGARQGMNDFKQIGYGGPCPPHGETHRFIYHVYALDTMLAPVKGITRAQLLMMMDGHILAQGELMGTYQRK